MEKSNVFEIEISSLQDKNTTEKLPKNRKLNKMKSIAFCIHYLWSEILVFNLRIDS